MPEITRSMAAGALLLPLLAACGSSFSMHEEFHQAVESGPAPVVRVENVAGEVAVEPWRRHVVDVAATKYASDLSQLRSVTIEVRRGGEGVSIVTRYFGPTHGGGVRYRISVPQDASVEIRNTAGSVSVGAVGGDVDVETQAGKVDAGLGRVGGNRRIELRATTGAVALEIARDSSATVDAESTVGSISSDFPAVAQTRENLVGSRASGRIGGGNAQIRLSTTTGAITLQAAK